MALEGRNMTKNNERTEQNDSSEYSNHITLNLNARFQPMHRHKLEDALEEMFKEIVIFCEKYNSARILSYYGLNKSELLPFSFLIIRSACDNQFSSIDTYCHIQFFVRGSRFS